ncbi:hypothetical protein AC1031_000199 [Aphanomyces cochlioides]|nr:hypothetical protein AC1031_000199 [Aphanomyces cochlioides]
MSLLSTDKIKQLGYVTMYVPLPTIDDSLERDYPEFQWNDDMSEGNRTRVEGYKEYIAAVLEDTKHLSVKTDFKLDVPDGKSQRLLTGKADLCIVPKESFTRNEIVMVIEVRPGSREETLSEANFAQSVGYFLAANTHFSRGDDRPPPIGLMTNLNDAWCFFWVSPGGKVWYGSRKGNGEPLDRKTALYYMRKHCNHLEIHTLFLERSLPVY